MSFRSFTLALAATLMLAAPALAAGRVTVGDLEISGAWTRATPPGAPTAGGYLTIANKGSAADTLTAVSTPLAKSSALHQMSMQNGVMSMRALGDGIAIPAGGSVTLAPDGLHIMFVTLKHSLKAGGTLPVTLTFAKAGSVTVDLPVLPLGSSGPAPAMGDMPGMSSMPGMDMSKP